MSVTTLTHTLIGETIILLMLMLVANVLMKNKFSSALSEGLGKFIKEDY
jgi:hypothetical protein